MARYFSPKPPPSNSRKIRGAGEKKEVKKESVKALSPEHSNRPLVVRVLRRNNKEYLVGPYELVDKKGSHLLVLSVNSNSSRPVSVRPKDLRALRKLTPSELESVKTFHEVFGDHQKPGIA